MPALTSLLVFAAIAFGIVVTPGPNIVVMRPRPGLLNEFGTRDDRTVAQDEREGGVEKAVDSLGVIRLDRSLKG